MGWQWRDHVRNTAFAGALTAVTVLGSVAPAFGAPIASKKGEVPLISSEFSENQGKLAKFRAWVEKQPELDQSGYIGEVHDADNLAIKLLWYGQDNFLAKAQAEAKKRGISTTVEYRSMSMPMLIAAMDRIENHKYEICRQGFDFTGLGGVGELDDGIKVQGLFFGPLAADSEGNVSGATRAARAALAAEIAEIAQGEVQLEEGWIRDMKYDPTRVDYAIPSCVTKVNFNLGQNANWTAELKDLKETAQTAANEAFFNYVQGKSQKVNLQLGPNHNWTDIEKYAKCVAENAASRTIQIDFPGPKPAMLKQKLCENLLQH